MKEKERKEETEMEIPSSNSIILKMRGSTICKLKQESEKEEKRLRGNG